ncbi:hypothetical protein NEICINOT_03377 [Neisseria cinerea ATCC 14685]|uniref:Uncharacterized protein n=1 Tax=Neisseria cinerea ATCC 14685 TaxID=546262 RepID=D0W158_NEICI|nr:hypothetical protein NEICINOT_03377 [Neisseria cinerea ATCC 14685]
MKCRIILHFAHFHASVGRCRIPELILDAQNMYFYAGLRQTSIIRAV